MMVLCYNSPSLVSALLVKFLSQVQIEQQSCSSVSAAYSFHWTALSCDFFILLILLLPSGITLVVDALNISEALWHYNTSISPSNPSIWWSEKQRRRQKIIPPQVI